MMILETMFLRCSCSAYWGFPSSLQKSYFDIKREKNAPAENCSNLLEVTEKRKEKEKWWKRGEKLSLPLETSFDGGAWRHTVATDYGAAVAGRGCGGQWSWVKIIYIFLVRKNNPIQRVYCIKV